jgi:NDP-sugar pyrophosphorylase family protein
MTKSKIAISVDSPLLDNIDSFIDGNIIRSRSQAIEYFLRKGIASESITTGVIMVSAMHQKISLQKFQGSTLIRKQIDFFSGNGITTIYIITPHSNGINDLLIEISNSPISVQIVENNIPGNAQALKSISSYLHRSSFIVMSGDIYMEFDLRNMIKRHMDSSKIVTIGLMTRQETCNFGNIIMEGDSIVDFIEKPKDIKSNIVNAGIYIFKPEVLEFIDPKIRSLEKDLFPLLAKLRQARGFFTHGSYFHLSEKSED